MSPSDFAKLTLRNLPYILLSTVVAIAAACGLFLLKKPTYVADATAYVTAVSSEGTTDSSYTGTLLAKQKVRSFIPVFTSRTTAERAIQQLGLNESPDAVAKRLQVTAPTDSVAINIKAAGDSPTSARDLADAIVAAGAAEVESLEGGPSAGVKIVPLASAALPSSPASPLLSRYLLLGALAGLLIGYALAFIRFRMDTRIRTIPDVEETQNSIVLGTLPADKHIGRQASKDTQNSDEKSSFISREALRKLRTNLRFVSIDNPPRAIVVTSSQPKDGKSTVAVRLAQVIAAGGSNVLLVDADLRRPTIANTLHVDGSLGLSGILTGDVFLDEAIQPTEEPNLHVLTAGRIPPNPSELLGSQRMRDLLEVLKSDYTYVIIDAPPLLQVTDGALLSASADGAIVVVRSGVTRKSELSSAIRHLDSVDAAVLGTVLNQVNSKRMSKIIDGNDYYGYGYGYGYASAKSSQYASVIPTTESKQPAVANVPFLRPNDHETGPKASAGLPTGDTHAQGSFVGDATQLHAPSSANLGLHEAHDGLKVHDAPQPKTANRTTEDVVELTAPAEAAAEMTESTAPKFSETAEAEPSATEQTTAHPNHAAESASEVAARNAEEGSQLPKTATAHKNTEVTRTADTTETAQSQTSEVATETTATDRSGDGATSGATTPTSVAGEPTGDAKARAASATVKAPEAPTTDQPRSWIRRTDSNNNQ